MSGFDLDWLSLRRPADRAARSAVVLGMVARDFAERPSVRITDLGAGSGSTRAAVGPFLGAGQVWRLVDIDAALLAAAAAAPGSGATVAETLDLARDLEAALDRPADLVTCSALLDLVSPGWIDRLARGLARRGLPFYAALTYDGRIEAHPPHPLDARVTELVNLHQTGDKGFGPALGPDAHDHAAARLAAEGFAVVTGRSDWALGSDTAALQAAYVRGHAEAVAETGGLSQEDRAAWLAFRLDAIERGESRILVGHGDLYAVPERAEERS